MADKKAVPSRPAYVVLREIGRGTWRVVGEAERRPGRTAKQARADAIEDATRGRAKPKGRYRAVLRSEWKIAAEL